MRRLLMIASIGAASAACADPVATPEAVREVAAAPMASVEESEHNGTFVIVGSPDNTPFEIELYLVDADGTGLINLTEDPLHVERAPSWSPNGKQIVFGRTPVGGRSDLFILTAPGGEPVPLTDTPDLAEFDADWSPNGKSIVFVRLTRFGFVQRSSIHVLDLRTGDERELISSTVHAIHTPKWSPDGKLIAYAAVTFARGPIAIRSIRPDGRDDNVLHVLYPDVSPPISGLGDLAWSPNGRSLAFAGPSGPGPTALWVVNRDGTNARVIADVSATRPVWSPNGRSIAFIAGRTIAILDLASSNIRYLGVTGSWLDWRAGGPRWGR